MTTWLGLQTQEFRDGIKVVAIDPSAPYAAGIRRALPGATIVVDLFHVVLLANQMLTRSPPTRCPCQHGGRGTRTDPAWAHRRLLLRAGDQLSPNGLARLKKVLREDDPTNESGAAWGIKELLSSPSPRRDRPATPAAAPRTYAPSS